MGQELAGPDFGVAEAVFTDGEEFRNGLAFLLDDDVVGVVKSRPKRFAKAFPNVLLPHPGMPMRTILTLSFIIRFHLLGNLFNHRRIEGSAHPDFFRADGLGDEHVHAV